MADRFFTDPSLTVDAGSIVPKIPGSVDGLFLTGLTGGGKFGGTGTVVPRWRQTHPPLKQRLLVGWGLLYPPDRGLRGDVWADRMHSERAGSESVQRGGGSGVPRVTGP